MPSSTKWRILVLGAQGGWGYPTCALSEMQMRITPSGTDQCTGGTASADGDFGGSFPASQAFNDNGDADFWASNTTPGPPGGWWLQYEFASAKNIVEYTIQARSGALDQTPVAWYLQYYDGAAWQTVDIVGQEATWSASEIRTYTVAGAPAAKSFWRILVDALDGGGAHGSIAEMQYRLTASGADQCTNGVAVSSNPASGFPPLDAFDNASGTFWAVNPGVNAWLEYQFHTPKDIVEYTVQARTGFLDQTPKDWRIQDWDGAAWRTRDTRTGETGWGVSEVRTYSVDPLPGGGGSGGGVKAMLIIT